MTGSWRPLISWAPLSHLAFSLPAHLRAINDDRQGGCALSYHLIARHNRRYGTCPPHRADELAGQPGSHWPSRERTDPRLLRALPGERARPVARDRLHRYAASDLRGARLSLERHRDERERYVRVQVLCRRRCGEELASVPLPSHARKRA